MSASQIPNTKYSTTGLSPTQISANTTEHEFWRAFFALDVDRDFLSKFLIALPKDECLHVHKSVLSSLFITCIRFTAGNDEDATVRLRAVETVSILLRCVLAKNLAGWEVMVLFAGEISKSDKVFMEFVDMIAQILGGDDAPAAVRHQVLQLAIIYTGSINQLSPGAYLLRKDLFPALVNFVKSPETERYTFEATLLLSFLANFHRSDAAKLNPYLQHIRDTEDVELMEKISWAMNFACDAAVRAYQEIVDDSMPTFAKAIGTLITSLMPDRALSSQPLDPPRDLFKKQPIEASVSLLPIFEFLFFNPFFTQIFTDTTASDKGMPTSKIPPLSYTALSLSSYLLTHGTSSASPRAMAYANLAMNLLLVMAENARVMEVFCGHSVQPIRLCRQRLPMLPTPALTRPPVCALLDCCVLWLRHNLHKRLEVYTYTTCICTCYRVLWYLQKVRIIRIDYEWAELWKAIIAVLGFLASKFDHLTTTGGVENLIQETLRLMDFAVTKAEVVLATPTDVHALLYELVRSSDIIRKQTGILQTLAAPGSVDRRTSLRSESASRSLRRVLSVISYYEAEISRSGAQTAKESLRIVARLVDREGVLGVQERQEEDPQHRGEDVIGFIRYGCADGLALML